MAAHDHLFKVIVTGYGITPRQLQARFGEDKYFKPEEDIQLANSYIRDLNVYGKDVGLQVWTKFDLIRDLKRTNGVLLCYNTGDVKSFEQLDTFHQLLDDYLPAEARIVVVGCRTEGAAVFGSWFHWVRVR